MTKIQNNFYAVRKGRNPGIYENEKDFKLQIQDFNGAEYRSCRSWQEAKDFIVGMKCNHAAIHLMPVLHKCLEADESCFDDENQEHLQVNQRGIREKGMTKGQEVPSLEGGLRKRKKSKDDQDNEKKKIKQSIFHHHHEH